LIKYEVTKKLNKMDIKLLEKAKALEEKINRCETACYFMSSGALQINSRGAKGSMIQIFENEPVFDAMYKAAKEQLTLLRKELEDL
jgi:hypothetical protein